MKQDNKEEKIREEKRRKISQEYGSYENVFSYEHLYNSEKNA